MELFGREFSAQHRHCHWLPNASRASIRLTMQMNFLQAPSGLHHLLPHEEATSAFDQIEVRTDLVGAIDCEIKN
ncbi:hypothetical protein ACFX13_019774 [Malus domestica]